MFVLVKTSNPSSAEIQDLALSVRGARVPASGRAGERLGHGQPRAPADTRSVGAVVGGTHPAQGAELRRPDARSAAADPRATAPRARRRRISPGLFDGRGTRSGGQLGASDPLRLSEAARGCPGRTPRGRRRRR